MNIKTLIAVKLQEAEDLLIAQATVQGKTFDTAELEDADVENIFEDLRAKIRAVADDVLEQVD